MEHHWTDDELTLHWSLTAEEMALLPTRVDYNRLRFAVQLKFFNIEGCFPRTPREIPTAALGFVAEQLGLAPAVFQQYHWHGRTRKEHRAAIRTFVEFRSFTAADRRLSLYGQGFQHVWRRCRVQSLYGRTTKLPPSTGYENNGHGSTFWQLVQQ